MANFAELDNLNYVKRVVVIDDNVPTSNGPLIDNPMHVDGEIYCQNLFKGGIWKQSPINNEFRKQAAGIDFYYDSVKNIFISPKPYSSWILNENNDWQAPIAYPTITTYLPDNNPYFIIWNETLQNWNATTFEDRNTILVWNSSSLNWQ